VTQPARGSAEIAPATSATEGITPEYRRYALLILVLVYTSSHVDRQVLAILLEPIKHELALSDTQLGFLSGIAFAIFYATLGIPMSMWAACHYFLAGRTLYADLARAHIDRE